MPTPHGDSWTPKLVALDIEGTLLAWIEGRSDRGVIVEHGPPAQFFTKANDPRTRQFLSQIL